jgi:polyphosphate kinase
LLVAPDTVRTGLTLMIRREIDNAVAGLPSGITMKLNSLVDEELIDELYAASRVGVPIDLIVRGMCALRPGVAGLSENVRVRSILGRFLEHARILRFRAGGEDDFWIGSPDLMHRNLDRRVETLVRVVDPEARRTLDDILERSMSSDIAAWELQPDASFVASGGTDIQGELVRSHRASQSHDGPVVG